MGPVLEYFPFAFKYQLQIAFWLGVWHFVYFSLSMLGSCLAWTCTGPVHTDAVFISSYVYHSLCLWKMLFLWSYPLPQDLTVLPSSLQHRLSSLEKMGLMKLFCFGLRTPDFLSLCTLSSCGPLCWLPQTARRCSPNVGWVRHCSTDID